MKPKSSSFAARAARKFALAASFFGMAAALCGCQVLSYRGPQGERLIRACLGGNTSLSSLAVERGADGIQRVELRGYRSDTAQAMGTVTEAAVRAAISSAKP